ncbi:hypothetical protein D9C01_13690, partial [Corynebacterium diphtheriae]
MDLFGAFASVGPLMASLLVFAILLSVFFDAMGVSVGLARLGRPGPLAAGQRGPVRRVRLRGPPDGLAARV